MEATRRPDEDPFEVVRVLLLVQGSILVATTIEALIWGVAFAGAAGPSFLATAAMAATIFVARARMRADRRWARRGVYFVEGVLLATLAIDVALAAVITGGAPPAVAVLTRFGLPLSIIALLRRAARAHAARVAPAAAAALEAA